MSPGQLHPPLGVPGPDSVTYSKEICFMGVNPGLSEPGSERTREETQGCPASPHPPLGSTGDAASGEHLTGDRCTCLLSGHLAPEGGSGAPFTDEEAKVWDGATAR